MDKSKYTLAAHAGMDFANPFSSATIDRAVELLALGAISVRPRVIDVGSGNGELSSRIARRWEAQVDAVDASAGMCAEARRRGAGTGVTVHESDAGEFARRAAGGTYHGAVCIGSSHALRGTEPMIRELARLVARGGVVLIGEGVWEQAPSKEYLKETGIEAGEFQTLAGLVSLVEAASLRVGWATTATVSEWDEYEWGHVRGIEAFAEANPGDPDVPAMVARSRAWRSAYLKHGRGVLGFAMIVAVKPR